jgi:RND family efflux transporter MFP subunit
LDLRPLTIDRSATTTRRRSRRTSGVVGWLVFFGVLAGIGWVFRKPLSAVVDRARLPRVETMRVQRTSSLAATAVSGTAANGYVVARTRAALSADTPGRIVELNVEEGSVVKRGDVVARLYADEYRAALEHAEAEVASARTAVERARAQRSVSAAAVERQRARARAAESDVAERDATARLAEINVERARRLVEGSVETQQRLDEAEAELERARAARESARSTLQAAQEDVRTTELEEAAADVAVAEAEGRVPVMEALRDQAAATFEKTRVRAPFDGVVVLKDAEVGEVVSPNSVGSQSRGSVVTMVDLASLEVQVDLPETSLSNVHLDAPADIWLDAFPEHRYAGRVGRIWPTANRQKATVEIRVQFLETDDRLRPEMGARVVFAPERAEAAADEPAPAPRILVPKSAIVRIEGQDGVFVLERDVARFRRVALGDERAGRVAVERGLVDGDRIVVEPPVSLSEGDRVLLEGAG